MHLPHALRTFLLPSVLLGLASTAAGQAVPNGLPRVKAWQEISPAAGGLATSLSLFDYFGLSLGAADLNGDGRRELLAAIPGDDEGGTDRGSLQVLFLRADGSIENQVTVAQGLGGFPVLLDDMDYFGRGLACLGDMDGDGVPEIACSAYRDDDGFFDAGAIYVLFMNANGTVRTHQKISLLEGGFTGAVSQGDVFGVRMATIGDLDGDGVVDLASTAMLSDDGGRDRGSVFVLFLNADGTVKGQQRIASGEGGFSVGLEDDDYFGSHVTAPGDVDGDGLPDIVVGAFGDDDGGPGKGAVYVLFLRADGTVRAHQKISATTGGFPGELDFGDNFGSALATIGDRDGDGRPTIAVGAYRDDDGGGNFGAVWLLELATDGTVQATRKISRSAGGFAGNLASGDNFGSGLADLGDIDGDGEPDLAVGAWFHANGVVLGGAVWVLRLDTSPTLAQAPAATSAPVPPTALADEDPDDEAWSAVLPLGTSWTPESDRASAPGVAWAARIQVGSSTSVLALGASAEQSLRIPNDVRLHGARMEILGLEPTPSGWRVTSLERHVLLAQHRP